MIGNYILGIGGWPASEQRDVDVCPTMTGKDQREDGESG